MSWKGVASRCRLVHFQGVSSLCSTGEPSDGVTQDEEAVTCSECVVLLADATSQRLAGADPPEDQDEYDAYLDSYDDD